MIVTTLLLTITLVAPTVLATPALGRGKRWVRSQPFTLMALTIIPDTFHVKQYRDGANLNTMLAWKARLGLFEKAGKAGLPWHFHLRRHAQGLTDEHKALFKKLHDASPGCTGWMVWDEPNREGMPIAAETISWLRENYPDKLVYSNALPDGGRIEKYHGSGPLPESGYGYEEYLRDFATILQPDIMMFDAYPFKEDGGTKNLFPTITTTRKVAQEFGMPYWAFVQSHADPKRKYRMPSESDIRMQAFMLLAYGYTGIAYFTYENQQGPAMITPQGEINPIYYHAAKLNKEIAHIGKALRFLESTDVRVILGDGNKLYNGAVAWTPGAGGDKYIKAITFNDRHQSDWKDILIGFFKDDDGRDYFMLTNLWHGKGASASERKLTVTLTLDQSVKTLGRLSRESGKPELLMVTQMNPLTGSSGKFSISLPGGTGELLRFGDDSFPGLVKGH